MDAMIDAWLGAGRRGSLDLIGHVLVFHKWNEKRLQLERNMHLNVAKTAGFGGSGLSVRFLQLT